MPHNWKVASTTYGDWILAVEDDPNDELLLRRALGKVAGDAVLNVVPDGPDALSLLASSAALPRVILLDLNLPTTRGDKLLGKIREQLPQHIPVVMLTTSNHPADVKSCYEAGAAAFVTKPSTFGELVALMGNIVEFWLQRVEVA